MANLSDAEIASIPLDERCTHTLWKARANACMYFIAFLIFLTSRRGNREIIF